jgi:ribonuclease Z
MHSTAKDNSFGAAKVKHLILGHYSTRYEDISFKEEADIIFPEVLLADDGRSFDFKQSQRLRKKD